MARQRGRADLPGRRRVTIAETTPQPLAIIVGLPPPMHQAAKVALEAAYPTWKVISTPFPRSFEKTYSFEPPLLAILRETCLFASAQPARPVPRPAQVILFYVEAPAWERMLDVFGYSVLPVSLRLDGWHWPNGRHWSVDSNATIDVLVRAARSVQDEPLAELKLRLERHSKDEALQLPPRNFQHRVEGNLVARFDQLLRTGDFAAVEFDDLAVDQFDHDNLGRFFRRVPANAARFRVDERGLVFATSPRGQHGDLWSVDLATLAVLDFRYMLEALFRFGTPLRAGFQHDVQWPHDRSLANEEFFDAGAGASVPISGDHANIFANDGVR